MKQQKRQNSFEVSKKLIHEKYVFKYFSNRLKQNSPEHDEYHILNKNEAQKIKNLRVKSIIMAAFLGIMGVITLYLPMFFFKNSFLTQEFIFNVPWFGEIPIMIYFIMYGLILAILEIVGLTILNLYTVRKIASICGFPSLDDPLYDWHIDTLFEVSLEKKDKALLTFGINPHEGLSQLSLFFISTMNILKATLSNIIAKIILWRVLGRFAIRAYVDLVGIPIFAFWNAYTTNRVIREAKVRIMAPELIYQLTEELYEKFKDNEQFKSVLRDGLQLIAVAKRNYHHNHFILVEKLLKVFEITQEDIADKKTLLNKVKNLDWQVKNGLSKLFIFGMIIDGKLSIREKKTLKEMREQTGIEVDFIKVKQWEKSFKEGKGLDNFFDTQIVPKEQEVS